MRHARRLVPALAVAVALAWCTGPVLWQLVTALKSTEELYRVPPGWLPASPTLEHFARVFDGHPFGRNLLNSAVVAGASALAALAFGSLAAYGLAILKIPGTRLVLGAALGAAMFPPIALVGPLFTLFDRLGLLNTYLALIIPHAALALPLTLWVLTSYFGEIPRDILKAAEVDGCTPLAALWHILLPVAAPGLATAGILAFIYSWNEFLFALSLAGTGRVQTVTVAIALFPGLEEFPWGQIAAASLIVTLPVIGVVLILQRRIVAGLTAGALGG